MGMRVAFVGASGTGKTTLAKMVEKLYGLEFNPVGSRSVAKAMGFDNPYDVDKALEVSYDNSLRMNRGVEKCASIAMTSWTSATAGTSMRARFQSRLQLAKVEWETERANFVSDRTTIDDYAYTVIHAHERLSLEFEKRARAHMSTYDAVFFCPVESFINVGDDASRIKFMAYHNAFQLVVQGALMNWRPDYYTIPGLDSRIDFVQKVLDGIEASREG